MLHLFSDGLNTYLSQFSNNSGLVIQIMRACNHKIPKSSIKIVMCIGYRLFYHAFNLRFKVAELVKMPILVLIPDHVLFCKENVLTVKRLRLASIHLPH